MRSIPALAALAIFACAPRTDPAPEPAASESRAAQPPAAPDAPGIRFADIEGHWRIVSADGAAPRAVGEDGGRRRTPRLHFAPTHYGGTSGCNFFGGLGLLEGGRYYGAPGGQTVMGCGDLTAQEEAVTGIFWTSPRIALEDGTLTLTSDKHRLVLRRDPSLDVPPAPSPGRVEPPVLAGTTWVIHAIDGRSILAPGRENGRRLVFEAESWTGQAACATLSGGWRQQGDRILLTGPAATTEQLCPPADAAIDRKLAELMAAGPRFVTGPNGEILIAAGGHWLAGDRLRDTLSDQAGLVTGAWRIAAIDGRPPAEGTRPALAFGPTGFAGTTGYNSIQGLYLAQGRRLFTAPGPQTEQGCGPLRAQEERITGLLAASPSIALAGEGMIALVDRSGMLLLRRDSAAGDVRHAPRAAAAPATFRAELHSLDCLQLRERVHEPESWIRLAPKSWELRYRCLTLGGVLRRSGARMHFFTDARPLRSPGCAEEVRPGLMKMTNSEARALVGVNGELLIAGPEHWLVGQVSR